MRQALDPGAGSYFKSGALEIVPEPIPGAAGGVSDEGADVGEVEAFVDVERGGVEAVAQKSGGGGVGGADLAVVETAEFKGAAETHGHAQRFDGEVAHARNCGAAADQDCALKRVGAGEAGAAQPT